MYDEEMSLLEFQQAFGSEEACLKYLFEKRWPEEFQCPHCGQGEYYFLKKRRLYQCRACGYQASVTAGTIFHKTRLGYPFNRTHCKLRRRGLEKFGYVHDRHSQRAANDLTR